MLDDSDYWLERAVEKTECGRRNNVGVWLACQLRDNRVSENIAKKTMKSYANQTPSCGGDPYTKSDAVTTCNAVYKREPRDPVFVDEQSEERDRLQERAEERERELFEKFKDDPTQLTDLEIKRLRYSNVVDGVDFWRTELAKDWMTPEEKQVFKLHSTTKFRLYEVRGSEVEGNLSDYADICDCDCANFDYNFHEGDNVGYALRKPEYIKMRVDLDDSYSEFARKKVEKIIDNALERRSKSI